MKQSSHINLLTAYVEEQDQRSKITTTGLLDIWLDYCEYSIRSQFDKNQKSVYKNKKRKKQVPQDFKNAIDSLNRQQKVQFYLRCVKHLKNFNQGKLVPPLTSDKGFLIGQGQTRSYNLKIWKKKQLRLDRSRHYMYAERQKKIKTYDLKDYILRKSKISDKGTFTFVLQAINNKPHQKSKTVHIRFDNVKTYQEWYQNIKMSIQYQQWANIRQMFGTENKLKMSSVTTYGNQYQNLSQKLNKQEKPMSASQVQPQKHNNYNSNEYSYSPTKKFTKGDQFYQKIMPQKSIKTYIDVQQKKQNIMQNYSKINRQNLQKKIQIQEQQIQKQYEKLRDRKKTFIDTLIQDEVLDFQELTDLIQEENQGQKDEKINLDIFHRIIPDYDLQELNQFSNYQVIQIPNNDQKLTIYKNLKQQNKLKIRMQFPISQYNPQQILSFISNPSHQFNSNIQEIQIKTMIASQNSAIIYLVLKAYNKLYRPRDFIFVRHVFKNNGTLYMIDKSMDNINYPPFMTIVRGDLSIIWGIYKNEVDAVYDLIGDLSITNAGYLNPQQELNLTLKYLNEFSNIYKIIIPKQSACLFNIDWDISKKDINKIGEQLRERRKTIKRQKQKLNEVDQLSLQSKNMKKQNRSVEQSPNYKKKSSAFEVYSQTEKYDSGSQKTIKIQHPQEVNQFQNKNYQEKVDSFKKIQSKKIQQSTNNYAANKIIDLKKQIKQEVAKNQFQQKTTLKQTQSKLKLQSKIVRKLDEKEGLIIVDKNFSSQKYILQAEEKKLHTFKQYPKIEGHPIWKGEWVHDSKVGGIIFVNQKKIQDQKGVLKFILTKIGKNILSGKSVLNISLPVDIFYPQSNLERLLISMGYGPKLLENLQPESSIIKLSKVAAFGLTNSILYLNMQKPFNPILGQTFQCWINGCPGYAQQISHHPPIAALMFYGRGYKITTQLQSKVQLHMNSGCGINDGVFKVEFQDKNHTEVCFMTPGGQISGLTYGDRKFNIVGKGYYWIQKQNIFLQITYDPHKKGFFSVGKQQSPSDYFQGKICEVKPDFMQNFIKGKKKQPTEKQKVKQLGKIEGIWNKYLKFNDKQIFNLQNDVPLQIQYERYPLPSDANWREDIQYRRLQQTTRAQTEKQRLQVIQRKDRKLREKYNKHK